MSVSLPDDVSPGVVRFRIWVGPTSSCEHTTTVMTVTADEALAYALAHLGVNTDHATIDTWDLRFPVGTFAIRHLTWRHEDEPKDSGWLAWLRDESVGKCDPATLLARVGPVVVLLEGSVP